MAAWHTDAASQATMPKKYRTAVRGEVSTYQGTPKKPSFAGIRSLDRALLAFCAAFRAFFASGAGVIPVTRLEDGGGLSVRVRRIHSSKWVSLEPPRRRMKEWSTVTKRFSDQVVTNSVERMRQGQGADVAAPEWQEEGRPLVRALADFKGPWGQLASNRAPPHPRWSACSPARREDFGGGKKAPEEFASACACRKFAKDLRTVTRPGPESFGIVLKFCNVFSMVLLQRGTGRETH